MFVCMYDCICMYIYMYVASYRSVYVVCSYVCIHIPTQTSIATWINMVHTYTRQMLAASSGKPEAAALCL